MVRTHGLTHIALAVRDLPRAIRFYRGLLGATITYEDPDHVELQTPGCKDVISLERADGRWRATGTSGGIAHFGFRLVRASDIQAAVREVETWGGRLKEQGEFSPGHPYAFLEDPDGYEVELWFE